VRVTASGPFNASGANKSPRSGALAASSRNESSTPKIFCIDRRSDECVRSTVLAYGTPFTFGRASGEMTISGIVCVKSSWFVVPSGSDSSHQRMIAAVPL